MESRKRHFVDDTDYSSSKKRAMSSASGSPTHVNGTMDTVSTREPRDEDELEVCFSFRFSIYLWKTAVQGANINMGFGLFEIAVSQGGNISADASLCP